MDKNYGQAIELLPQRLKRIAQSVDEAETERVMELRMRSGRRLAIYAGGREKALGTTEVTAEDLQTVLEIATHCSVHTIEDSLSEGYITVSGGHRIGVCGALTSLADGRRTLRDISSVSIRIGRCINTSAEGIEKAVVRGDVLCNTLIISPPGHGKTTALRDLVRRISDKGFRVSLVDERGEIAGKVGGIPQFDVGRSTDILDGSEKAEGAMQMLRTMGPGVIALDEITDERDIAAVERIVGCGVGIIATVHGESVESVFSRPEFSRLLHSHAFSYAVCLRHKNGEFTYKIEEI